MSCAPPVEITRAVLLQAPQSRSKVGLAKNFARLEGLAVPQEDAATLGEMAQRRLGCLPQRLRQGRADDKAVRRQTPGRLDDLLPKWA